jgi:tetratricopeptide (TPR) repeat protein
MWCNFVTYQQQIAERYTYLANIGMMYAIANLIINYPIVITVFLVAYLVRLWFVMDTYLSDYWAVEHTLMDMKKMHYMWLMRGVKKFMARDYPGALCDFNEAYQHKNYDLKILYNLSVCYFVLGDEVHAKEYLEKARVNIYDELEEAVKPSFDKLDGLIKLVENAKAKGEKMVQVDLSQIMVVK